MSNGRTHYEGCWRYHLDCAVREIERLRARVEWPEEPSDAVLRAAVLCREGPATERCVSKSGWRDMMDAARYDYNAMRAAHVAAVKEGKDNE